jgi:tetratricopeptide (TPR) repeat protein
MALGDLGLVLTAAGHDDQARPTLVEAADAFRQLGDAVNEGIVRSNLAVLDLFVGDFESARAGSERALTTGRETGHQNLELMASLISGEALLGLGRPAEARASLSNTLELVVTIGGQAGLLYVALGAAALAAGHRKLNAAARLRGAAAALRQAAGIDPERRQVEFEQHFDQPLIEALGAEAWAQAQADGAAMTLDQALALARLLCDEEMEDAGLESKT